MKFNFSFKKNGGALFHNLWKGRVREYLNPMRDWLIILSSVAVVFLGGVGYIAFDFYHQLDTQAGNVTTEAKPAVYKEKEVIEYATIYTEKEQMFDTLRKDRNFVPVVPVESEVTSEAEAESPEIDPLANIELAR